MKNFLNAYNMKKDKPYLLMHLLRKKYFFLFVLIFTTFFSYSQENFIFNLNAAYLGLGGNFPYRNDYNNESYISVLTVGIEHKNTNLGIEFSPFTAFYWTNDYNKYKTKSVLNFTPYWNVINVNFRSKMNFYLGPFNSINYMFIDKEIIWENFIYTAGLQMGLRLHFNKFNYNFFSLEGGCRNIHGHSKYYVGGKIDLIVLFVGLFYLYAGG